MGETKWLFFVLLISFLGSVQAESCSKPQLKEGFINTDEEMYTESTTLHFGCNKGWKPVANGWWGITECKNGQWSPKPQCIDENACITPDIPNAKVNKPNENGWYSNGKNVFMVCDEFYETKRTTAKCENGSWKDLPVCTKKEDLCGEPPRVANAVIIQEYKDTFLDSSFVHYKCQDTYALNKTGYTICLSGIWNGVPECTKVSIPSPTRKTITDKEVQKPTGRPEPSGSGPFIPVDKCGKKPVVDNGDFISDNNGMALTYKCNLYYKRVGPEQVMCYSNGVWSETPICKEPCKVSPNTFDVLNARTDEFVMEGDYRVFFCEQKDYYEGNYNANVHCKNGKVTLKPCILGCRLEQVRYPQLDINDELTIENRAWTKILCKDLGTKYRQHAYVQCVNGRTTVENCQ